MGQGVRMGGLVRSAALLVGLTFLVGGVLGIIVPGAFGSVTAALVTPAGLYVGSLTRLVLGIVLWQAAPSSRFALPLRVLGAAMCASAMALPFVGALHARSSLSGLFALEAPQIRAWACVGVVAGLFVVYAMTAGQRRVMQPPR